MTGPEKVALLLRILPAQVVDAVLTRLSRTDADAVRTRLQELSDPVPPQTLRQALREFQDVLRIAERPPPPSPDPEPPPAPAEGADAGSSAVAESPAGEPPLDDPDRDPVAALQDCRAEVLAGVLRNERATTVALVLGYLDLPQASAVLKLLPQATRLEAIARQAQPVALGPELITRMLRAVLTRCREAADVPRRASGDELVQRMADLIRSLGREERRGVLEKLEGSDQDLAAKVRKTLYRFSDIVRVDDQTVQKILAEMNIKTLALALRGAPDDVTAKIHANVSKRTRESIGEEMDLLKFAPPNQVEEARDSFVQILLRLDAEGKLAL